MITNRLEFTTDLAQGVRMVRIGRLFAQSDKEAHTIEIMVKDGAQAADLTGLSASCFLIRSDDSTVNVTGTITGSTVTVTLNAACYEVPGHFSLIVKAYDTDHSTAVFWADGTVTRSTTDSLVDPEHVVPDLATLLAQIETIREATEAAGDAADLATEKAGLADTKAGLADTAATAANTAAASISGMTVAASGLAAGTPPTATVSDVSGHKHIAFGIPAGAAGATGAVPNIQVGTVTTVAPDVSASVTRRSGSPDTAPVFDFDIPRGQTGSVGAITAGDIPMSSSDQTSVASAIGAIPKTDFIGASSFATGAHGLVPAPAAGDQDKVLKGDGSWGAATVPDMTGATSSAAGTHGLVPAPGSATLPQLFYLSSNGTFRAPIATRSMVTSGDIVYEQFSTISATSSTETGGRLYTARKVLWENSNSSSSFGAQTVTLSDAVDGFLFWLVVFYIAASNHDEVVPFVLVGKNGLRATFSGATTNTNKANARQITIDSTGKELTFGACYYNGSSDNTHMIPSAVYGFFKL